MKFYSHKIAKSKLVKLKLTEQQIAKVYSYKSKAKQLLKAKRFASANKAVRAKKFNKTGLALYTVRKQINKLAQYAKTQEYRNLSKKQQFKLEKKYFKLNIKLSKIHEARAKTLQAKEDIRQARQDKLDRLHGRIVAGEHRYYINRPTQESYDYNGTLNRTTVEGVTEHYADELDKLLKGEQDSDGNGTQEPMSFQEAIDYLFEEAIRNGDLEELAQGAGYGYIDKSDKEVISPV